MSLTRKENERTMLVEVQKFSSSFNSIEVNSPDIINNIKQLRKKTASSLVITTCNVRHI